MFPSNLAWGFTAFFVAWLVAGFGAVGQPHILSRAMAIDSADNMGFARNLKSLCGLVNAFTAISIGLAARVFLPELAQGGDPELALLYLSADLLPAVLVGLMMAGLFAAIVSTADSQILSCSAALTQDLFPKIAKSHKFAKLGTLTITAVVLIIALSENESVFSLIIFAWSVLAAISKWDTLIDEYSLEELRDRLLQIEEFRNLIQLCNQARLPVRLIPISSVGMGFAELQPDGSMAKTGSLPNPFLVEMPLACILPDMIKTTLEEIIKKKQAESKPIEVKPNLSFWERLGQVVGGVGKVGVAIVKQILPIKYRFAEDILEDLIDFLDDLEKPAQEKREAAAKKTEELRRKQAESLRKVTDEETALKHVVNCFISLTDELESKFPASNLKQI
ncbi:MAG: hypothetical protein QNJ47_07530 [Nostocaceae cyanobacterium]|nr:hypothetical protein [Nostocaceae cyanobacterium]